MHANPPPEAAADQPRIVQLPPSGLVSACSLGHMFVVMRHLLHNVRPLRCDVKPCLTQT